MVDGGSSKVKEKSITSNHNLLVTGGLYLYLLLYSIDALYCSSGRGGGGGEGGLVSYISYDIA